MTLTKLRRRIMYMIRRNHGRPVPAKRIVYCMGLPSSLGSWHDDQTSAALDLMTEMGTIRWIGDRVIENHVKRSVEH